MYYLKTFVETPVKYSSFQYISYPPLSANSVVIAFNIREVLEMAKGNATENHT